MKRREFLFAAPPIAEAVLAGQTTNATKPKSKKKTGTARRPNLTSAQLEKLDAHLLAMLVLLTYRYDTGSTVTYPNINIVKNNQNQTQAARQLPVLENIDPSIYTAVYTTLTDSTAGPQVTRVLHHFQNFAENIMSSVAPTAYPEHDCPKLENILKAVSALVS